MQHVYIYVLEILSIGVNCIEGAHIPHYSFAIRLTSPSSPSVNCHLRLSEYSECAAADLVGVGVAQIVVLGWAV